MLERLSILDQSPVAAGSTRAQGLRETLALAEDADRLGFHRLWVAEHHGSPALAGTSPEVLLAALGAATRRLRLGSGGIMLPHYSPLKVAECFAVLGGLHPGRIDLGLGRAAGTDPRTAVALQRDRRQALPDDFPEQLAELLHYVGQLPDEERPQPWLLGSSPQSRLWADEHGLPYAFADFITPSLAGEVRADAVAAWALAADDEREAERLASSSRMLLSLLRRGRLIPVPPPEEAERHLAERGVPQGRRAIVGTPQAVRERLEALCEQYGAREAIVVTITHDPLARRRSYALLADAFGLSAATAAAGTPAAA